MRGVLRVQVRTQTLVKSAIVQVDATPFKQFYTQHYGVEAGLKKKSGAAAAAEEEKKAAKEVTKHSNHVERKLKTRNQNHKLDEVSCLPPLPVHSRPHSCRTTLWFNLPNYKRSWQSITYRGHEGGFSTFLRPGGRYKLVSAAVAPWKDGQWQYLVDTLRFLYLSFALGVRL